MSAGSDRVAAVARRLTTRDYLAYAAGDAANHLSSTMASMFLVFYYTNVVGVEGAVIGTMLLVVRLVGAVADVVVGRAVDARRPGRLGTSKPFILWFSLPLLLSSMAVYSARTVFPDISGPWAVVYMCVTYTAMGSVFYTLVNVPYGSMAPALTTNPAERGRLATYRGCAAAAAVLALASVLAPQVRANLRDPEALQRSFFLTTAGFVVVGILLYLFLVLDTREQLVRPAADVSLRDGLRTLSVNPPLLWLSVATVLFLAGFTTLGTLGAFVAIYVQWDAAYIAYNVLAQTVALFVVAPLVPTVVRTIGKRAGCIVLGGVSLLGALVLAFTPVQTVPVLGLVAFFLVGIGLNGVNPLLWALEADTVEYGEWRTGERNEGRAYAVFSFARKLGQALGGFVGGLALTIAGYSAARASTGLEQAPGVADDIQLATGALVGGFTLLSITLIASYPLSGARSREVSADLATRRAEAARRLSA